MKTWKLSWIIVAVIGLSLGLSWSVLGAGCDHPEFFASRAQVWAAYPLSIVSTDFNGDGVSDLATANDNTTGTVSVALGNGDGTFGTNFNYRVGTFPRPIFLCDLNHDSKIDLAVIDDSGFLTVLAGDGLGKFATNFVTSIGAPPGSVMAIGDLNGDTKEDVITASDPFITLHFGKGDLTFQTNANLFTSFADGVLSIAIGDVNGDGKADIIVGGSNGTDIGHVLTFLGDGSGGFQTNIATVALTNNIAIAIGDFNGDGSNDVVTVDSTSGKVLILLSNGDGSFRPNGTYDTDINATMVKVADFNKDGKVDVVVAANQKTYVLIGNGNGTFQQPMEYESAGNAIAFGDYNSDGKLDIVGSSGGLDGFPNVWMLEGNGDGTFQEAPVYPTGHGPLMVATGDFNGDTKIDMAVPNAFTNTISVFLNKGDGTFGTNVDYVVGKNPQSVVVGDFNKDNKLDLLVANENTNRLSLLLGNGDGTFQTNVSVGAPFLGVTFVVAGDFNHDGKLDFAIPGIFGIEVYKGNGNGTFQAAVTSSSAFILDKAVGADVNSDNNTDLIVGSYTGTNVLVLLGNNDGTFQTPRTNFAGTAVYDVAVGDLNGDGKLDIAVADFGCNPCNTSYPHGKVQVLLGNGNGTFQPAVGYLVDPSVGAQSVTIADVNGDGKPDLIVGGNISPAVWVMLNNGDGTFQQGVPMGVESYVPGLTTADVNGDGRLDILAANQVTDSISVLINTCPALAPVGLAVALSPATGSNSVSTSYSVVATVTSNGTPKSGASLNFSVTSGPNVGQTGTATSSVSGQGTFTYTGSATTGADVIRAIATSGGKSATGTATVVWTPAAPNLPPIALCHDVTTNAGVSCTANVPASAVDNGSSDPDGTIVSRTLTPAGPYARGVTSVSLTVTDNQGATNYCQATITVIDTNAPSINCHTTIITNVPGGITNAVVNFAAPTTSDNCAVLSSDCEPASGSVFEFGTNFVTCTVSDTAGNTNSCTFKIVIQNAPPVAHDFAVTSLKAPKKVTLKINATPKPGKVAIAIQNAGTVTEVIPDMATLTNLVALSVESLGACPAPVISLTPPKSFPITLTPRKSLKLNYLVDITCANDPAAGAGHEDYRYSVIVDPSVLDGNSDVTPSNNTCPRVPSGSDKGCGGKTPSHTLGGDILTDVVEK